MNELNAKNAASGIAELKRVFPEGTGITLGQRFLQVRGSAESRSRRGGATEGDRLTGLGSAGREDPTSTHGKAQCLEFDGTTDQFYNASGLVLKIYVPPAIAP